MSGIFASFTRSEKWLISFVMLLVGGGYGIQQFQADRKRTMAFSASAPLADKPATAPQAVLPVGLLESGRININTADGKLLETLPGIGPSLAGAILRHREDAGPFASLADVDKVPGVGPAMMSKLAPLVEFGTVPANGSAVPANRLPVQGASAVPAQALASGGMAAGVSEMVNINTATAAELDLLVGVGPAIAKRILEDRQVNGVYKTPESLMRVKGIGPAILQKNHGRIRVQ